MTNDRHSRHAYNVVDIFLINQGEIDYLDDGVFTGLIKDAIAGEHVTNNVAFGSEGLLA